MLEIFDGLRRLWEMGYFFYAWGSFGALGSRMLPVLRIFFSFLFGVGAVSFIFCRRVAFLFRVAAAYVSCGDVFGGVSTLDYGARCG